MLGTSGSTKISSNNFYPHLQPIVPGIGPIGLAVESKSVGTKNNDRWATKKTHTTFHYTGWFIGILMLAY